MRLLILALCFTLCSTPIFAQKESKVTAELTHEMVDSFKKLGETGGRYASYKATDGHTYKVGDTIVIGKSANEHYFKYYSQGTGILSEYEPMPSNKSGDKVVIKGIRVEGAKREGFRVWMRVSNAYLSASQINNFEGALREGEVISQGLTREAAIKQLKEYKEMRDMDIITDEEFEAKRDELKEIIKNR